MKIELSSAEFNNQIFHALFGSPLIENQTSLDKYNVLDTGRPEVATQFRICEDQDISKINTWLSYKQEISGLYPISKAGGCAYLQKDIYDKTWLLLAFTGGAYLYRINDIF